MTTKYGSKPEPKPGQDGPEKTEDRLLWLLGERINGNLTRQASYQLLLDNSLKTRLDEADSKTTQAKIQKQIDAASIVLHFKNVPATTTAEATATAEGDLIKTWIGLCSASFDKATTLAGETLPVDAGQARKLFESLDTMELQAIMGVVDRLYVVPDFPVSAKP